MPELPEVETVRRDLQAGLVGRTIQNVTVFHAKVVNATESEYQARLIGARFVAFERVGKLLKCQLSTGDWLGIHLKMTGQIIICHDDGTRSGGGHPSKIGDLPSSHTRVMIECDGGATVYFNDQRLFGWLHLYRADEGGEFESRLGPDAWLDLPELEYFMVYRARYPRREIKAMLLDQGFLAGIGNIYADEICAHAGLYPGRRIGGISEDKIGLVRQGIAEILAEAVACRGTSFHTFVDSFGQKGEYVHRLRAYGRAGESCKICKKPMIKGVVAQRGTTWCPDCQGG